MGILIRIHDEVMLVKRLFPLGLMLFLVVSLCACAAPKSDVDGISSATALRYREGEVRDYQGSLLDPSVGPRDNSISGVQKVDMGAYTLTIDGLVNAARVGK